MDPAPSLDSRPRSPLGHEMRRRDFLRLCALAAVLPNLESPKHFALALLAGGDADARPASCRFALRAGPAGRPVDS